MNTKFLKHFVKCKNCSRIEAKSYCMRNGYMVEDDERCSSFDIDLQKVIKNMEAQTGKQISIHQKTTSGGVTYYATVDELIEHSADYVKKSIEEVLISLLGGDCE